MASPKHLCPSVGPESPESKVFAVVAGTSDQPEVVYLDKPQATSKQLLELAAPVEPTEVFRFAADCIGKRCLNFDRATGNCTLAERVVRHLPIAVDKLPPCSIRKDCVWWNQEGGEACKRCPQVVHKSYAPPTCLRKTGWGPNGIGADTE